MVPAPPPQDASSAVDVAPIEPGVPASGGKDAGLAISDVAAAAPDPPPSAVDAPPASDLGQTGGDLAGGDAAAGSHDADSIDVESGSQDAPGGDMFVGVPVVPADGAADEGAPATDAGAADGLIASDAGPDAPGASCACQLGAPSQSPSGPSVVFCALIAAVMIARQRRHRRSN